MRGGTTHFEPRIAESTILDRLGIAAGRYFLVTCHRAEHVDIRVAPAGHRAAVLKILLGFHL